MNLTPRLQAAAALVPECASVADIGTDHAHILIHLLQKGICQKAIAADINKGPLERARVNITRAGLDGKIELRLSDGLDNIHDNEADTVVIAGMGGELIAGMLAKPKPAGIKRMVLQPMTDIPLVRKAIHENGMVITAERLAAEKDKIYNILSCEYGSGQIFSETDYIVSPFLQDDPLFKTYIKRRLAVAKHNLEQIKKADKQGLTARFEYLISVYEKFI